MVVENNVEHKPIRYISLFSGIEAASVAWHPLGWEPVAFADFDDFPSAVLAHRFPDVPNLKDITKVDWNEYKGKAELVVGGSPCQSFSVAGKRLGMDDPRGNLAIEYLRVIDAVRPKWFIYENVAGLLSSDDGRDFGAFLGLVGELGYGFAYRVLDAQHFGVPQRRRRVFVVGCADGDWRSSASVLFERESLRRNPQKSRKTRQNNPDYSQRGFDAEGWTFGGPDLGDRRGIIDSVEHQDDKPIFIQNAQTGVHAWTTFDTDKPSNTVGTAPDAVGQSYRLDSINSNSMKSKNPHSGVAEVNISPTLDTTDPNPSCNQGGLAIIQEGEREIDEDADIHAMMGSGQYVSSEITNTIVAREGGVGNTQHTLVQQGEYQDAINEEKYVTALDMSKESTEEIGTVCARVGNQGKQDFAITNVFAIQDADHVRDDGGNPATGMGINITDDKQYTLLARGVHGVAQIEDRTFVDGFHGTLDDVASTLSGGMLKANLQCVGEETEGIVFTQNQREEVREMEVAGTLNAEDGTHQTNFVRQPEDDIQAFTTKGDGSVFEAEVHPTLQTGGGQAGQGFPAVRRAMVVRKLTPIECERLQGFPDNWTQVPWRGKPAEECPDSHRYKACGNSMAVPVMRFIGEGIDFIHKQNLTPQPTTSDNRVLDSAQDGVVVSKGSMGEWFD
tara:strand:- start:1034 stop:3052 length:2019 start_codon:yes stop_codon:yes gene_type:complete